MMSCEELSGCESISASECDPNYWFHCPPDEGYCNPDELCDPDVNDCGPDWGEDCIPDCHPQE